MFIVCVATNRITTTITEEYLRMAHQSPGSGHIKTRDSNVLIDFTDPHRVLCRQPNCTIQYFMSSRGDIHHGFPHHHTMTNFIYWQQYYICFSEGLIWTINQSNNAWNVAIVINSDDYEWQPNSRNDFLYAEGDRMTLFKFLPNRATCERVIFHEYTLCAHNDNYPNTEVHTPITLSRSVLHSSEFSQSTPSSTTHSDNGLYIIAYDPNTPILPTQTSPLALAPENDENSNTSRTQSPSTLESNDNSDHGSNYSSCKICLTDYGNRTRSAIIPCGHLACSNCIRQSMKENNRCPFCRKNIQHTLRLFE